jgi:HEAT repeat protein
LIKPLLRDTDADVREAASNSLKSLIGDQPIQKGESRKTMIIGRIYLGIYIFILILIFMPFHDYTGGYDLYIKGPWGITAIVSSNRAARELSTFC